MFFKYKPLFSIGMKYQNKIENPQLSAAVSLIHNKLKLYGTLKELAKLDRTVTSEIEALRKRINEFSLEWEQNKSIIRRFDEVICSKASKITLENVDLKFQNYPTNEDFEEYQNEISDKIRQYAKIYKNVDDRMNKIQKSMEAQLSTSMTSVLYKLRKELKESYGGKPVDYREFEAKMSLKADAKEFYDLKQIAVEK